MRTSIPLAFETTDSLLGLTKYANEASIYMIPFSLARSFFRCGLPTRCRPVCSTSAPQFSNEPRKSDCIKPRKSAAYAHFLIIISFIAVNLSAEKLCESACFNNARTGRDARSGPVRGKSLTIERLSLEEKRNSSSFDALMMEFLTIILLGVC